MTIDNPYSDRANFQVRVEKWEDDAGEGGGGGGGGGSDTISEDEAASQAAEALNSPSPQEQTASQAADSLGGLPNTEDKRPGSFSLIAFQYSNPSISVDVNGRFVTHEIIGGTTVRQKIGEDPIEVDVSGVCRESTARKLDALRDASYGTIFSDRLRNGDLTVQFESVSTSPMDDGGAVPLNDTGASEDSLLYTFDMSCTEVEII